MVKHSIRYLYLVLVLIICTSLVQNIEYDPLKNPLRLEGGLKSTQKLYPGMRFNVYYRIDYHGDVSLTEEELPLLDLPQLKKIGGVQVNQGSEGLYHYQEFIQTYEKSEAGRIEIPASHVKANIKLEAREKKVEITLPEQVIEVFAFPQTNKPAAFNGAIGPQTMLVSLESPSSVEEGDLMRLKIVISSAQYPSTIRFPDITCQSGFSGFYQIGDFSARIEADPSSVTFGIDIRPLSAVLSEIPKIEYVYFNPKNQKYETIISAPISIQVKALSESPYEVKELVVETDWKEYLSGAAHEEETLNAELNQGQREDEIGNIYFRFREYPYAAYHYYKSLLNDPDGYHVNEVHQQLNKTLSELKVRRLNIAISYNYFVWYGSAFVLMISLVLFGLAKKKPAKLLIIFAVGLIFVGVVEYYQRPLLGLLIEVTVMHQMPDEHSAYVNKTPLSSGEGIEILAIDQRAEWVKIQTQEGDVGYVPMAKVRLL